MHAGEDGDDCSDGSSDEEEGSEAQKMTQQMEVNMI